MKKVNSGVKTVFATIQTICKIMTIYILYTIFPKGRTTPLNYSCT